MEKQQLFRVRVLSRNPKSGAETSIDIGPAMIQDAAQMFCDTVVKHIRAGKIHDWSDPIIYPVYN